VQSVRYRKSFDVQAFEGAEDIGALEQHAQRSVEIISASFLVEWLEQFNLQKASYASR
jgi:hypothetical protein